MNELVSWDAEQSLGKIESSEWMCPRGSVGALRAIEISGQPVTDAVIREKARGRLQHLEMTEFPEGYRAVRIIESETGRVLTDSVYSRRYDGLAVYSGAPSTTCVISGRPIGLPDGREITSIMSYTHGTETVARPTQVAKSEPDHLQRLRTAVHITPQKHRFYMVTEGRVGAIDGARAKLEVRQRDSNVTGKLAMQLDGVLGVSDLNLDLDADGQAAKLSVYRPEFLKALGVNTDSLAIGCAGRREIAEPQQQSLILDAAAEALGLEKWQGLDLRLTASGLYASMGQRNFDPTSVLVSR